MADFDKPGMRVAAVKNARRSSSSSARSRTPRSSPRTTRTSLRPHARRQGRGLRAEPLHPAHAGADAAGLAPPRRRVSRACSSRSRCRRTGLPPLSTSRPSSRTRRSRARSSARSTRPASPARSRSLRPSKSKEFLPRLGP
jgi:hypothetical protein